MFTYTFFQVLSGTALLGFVSGMIGSFMVVRKTALLGDVISHAMVPGIACAVLFFSLYSVGWNTDTYHSYLYIGGIISGALGIATLYAVQRYTILKNDVVLALVLSVFFGVGVSILSVVQQLPGVFVVSIESYLYGSAATMQRKDIFVNGSICLFVVSVLLICYRPIFLISFDQSYAKLKGISVRFYECVYYFLVLLVCITGIQAVGVLLVLALLLIPGVSMRFWTHSFSRILWGAGFLGALSTSIGTFLSTVFSGVPSGPMIVLSSVAIFIVSFLFAPSQGLVWNYLEQVRYQRKMFRDHVLRFWFEYLELAHGKTGDHAYMADQVLSFEEIHSFEDALTRNKLQKMLAELISSASVIQRGENRYSLSSKGVLEAEQIVHQHRLWELFLLEYADIAPAMIDRSADRIEHVLEPHIVRELEYLLAQRESTQIIKSPHPIS